MIAVELARVVEQSASRNRRLKNFKMCFSFSCYIVAFFVFLCVINFSAM